MKSISKIKESEKFNKLIQECEEYSKSIDASADITKSFPRFILHLYFNLNQQNIEESLRGLGSRDDGIDAFFVSEEEKKYYIIQFKSRTNYDQKEGKDGKKEWFSLLDTFVERVKLPHFTSKNNRINEIKQQLENDLSEYKQELFMFHLGTTSAEIESNFINISYYSQTEIIKKFVQFYEADLPDDCAPDEVLLEVKPYHHQEVNYQNNYIYFTPKAKNGKTRKTIAFPITGDQIINLINQGTTILERNVRGYLGDNNAVNKGMIRTALETPEYFYFFNNGISITCDELILVGNGKNNPKITLKKPQVINGAQTVNSLKSAYELKIKKLKKEKSVNPEEEAFNYMKNIHVLCKIMESNKKSNTTFAKEVSNYSNTQNKIKPTDFYANRPEQEIIKEEILKYGITYNIKRGKNFEYKQGYFINMEDLGESHLGQTEDPFFAKSTQIFVDDCENDEQSSYTKIFGNNGVHNSKRTMLLAKTFFIYNFLGAKFTEIKKTYNEIDLLIGKNSIEITNFEIQNKGFFKVTRAKKYFDDIVKQKLDPHIDIVSKYIYIMDFKILCYILRQVIDNYFLQNHHEDIEKVSLVFESYINKKNYSQIEILINTVLEHALKLYAKSLKEILKDNKNKIQKRHPKTKEARSIIDQNISEYISGDEYIKFEY